VVVGRLFNLAARAIIERKVALALVPPVLVLVIGSGFVWVVRGFR